ncbi:MAG TPA: hypothetical protein VFY68_06680, partial [Nitrososphaeraceae archaeon]|nr:hypothetical protein [Nitrososphaeraceae archaeon]
KKRKIQIESGARRTPYSRDMGKRFKFFVAWPSPTYDSSILSGQNPRFRSDDCSIFPPINANFLVSIFHFIPGAALDDW